MAVRPGDVSEHVRHLGERLDDVEKSLESLTSGAQVQEMRRIIQRKGWTTPAELAFAETVLEHASGQIHQIDRLLNSLVSAAQKVELNPQPLPP